MYCKPEIKPFLAQREVASQYNVQMTVKHMQSNICSYEKCYGNPQGYKNSTSVCKASFRILSLQLAVLYSERMNKVFRVPFLACRLFVLRSLNCILRDEFSKLLNQSLLSRMCRLQGL